MQLSKALQEKADTLFLKTLQTLPTGQKAFLDPIAGCLPEEQNLLKYLYAISPVSDWLNTDFRGFLSYARHGLYLYKTLERCRNLPENIFLDYVVSPRVNNEDLEVCREAFWQALCERIQGLPAVESVLEINYWCAENATYQTTDDRTASPLTVYKTGWGRCGEESVFTVSALRSAGFPARQVYAPRWSHCDDNHAWVEVWIENQWFFMGACEPEPTLNRGWFTYASSRAMYTHTHLFSLFPHTDNLPADGRAKLLENTQSYAKTRAFSVGVMTSDGLPACGARVDIEILNYSEFRRILTLYTGQDGFIQVQLGLGSVHIHASKDNLFAEGFAMIKEQDEIQLILGEHPALFSRSEFDFHAPKDSIISRSPIRSEQLEMNAQRLQLCVNLRSLKHSNPEWLADFEAFKSTCPAEYQDAFSEYIALARGNTPELIQFLQAAGELSLKKLLLSTLHKKDFTDIKAKTLLDHMNTSLRYKNRYPEAIFAQYILSPKIACEKITPWRSFLSGFFTKEEQDGFQKNARALWDFVNSDIAERPELDYSELITAPVPCLQYRTGSLLSKKILFIALCRSIGIPSRLNPADQSPEVYKDGEFHSIDGAQKNALLQCTVKSSQDFQYFQTWTLAKRKGALYETLDLKAEAWQNNRLDIPLASGEYRLLTSNRLPNGDILGSQTLFTLGDGEKLPIELSLRKARSEELFMDILLEDFALTTDKDEKCSAQRLIEKNAAVFLWLDTGKEPTEHVLNELIEGCAAMDFSETSIYFVLKEPEALSDRKLQEALNILPDVHIVYDYEPCAPALSRRIFVEPDKFPLILVVEKNLRCLYGFSGYNVGIVGLLQTIIRALNERNH